MRVFKRLGIPPQCCHQQDIILSSIPNPTESLNRGTAALIQKRIKYEKISINKLTGVSSKIIK